MSEKLKPCPFCGGRASHYEEDVPDGTDKVWHRVGCDNGEYECQATLCETAPYPTKKQAIEAWNTRRGEK